MPQTNETNTFLGIVSVTTSKSTERDWIGRVKSEETNFTVEIMATVPQPFLDAAASISKATSRITAGATSLGKISR